MVPSLAPSPRPHTWTFALFVLALIAGSPTRWVGDGGEYLAMAINMTERGRPWMTDGDIAVLRQDLATRIHQDWDIITSTHVAPDGTRDFVHFWFYSALASPLVKLATAAGLNPLYGFAALNALLVVTVFVVALPRLGVWITWLLLAGPLIWWLDKAHTEVFTFSCLTIGLLLLTDAPIIALVALGAAATQNPPIVALIPLAAMALLVTRSPVAKTARFWVGVALGLLVALIHVAYYYRRYGETSLLLRATRDTFPSLREMTVVPLDLDLGLLPSFPALAIVLLIALVTVAAKDPRRLVRATALLACNAGLVFLVSFAKTANMHHGATPGMSRYGLWLIPLAMPWLVELQALGGQLSRTVVAIITVPSVIASCFTFHPARPDNYRQPTWIAHTVWTRYPGLDNPLPEIFVESQLSRRARGLPFATERCEKVLLVGRGDTQGMWPTPCYPVEIPAECRVPGQFCYANRTDRGYDFVLEPNPVGTEFAYDPGRVWPRHQEALIRQALTDIEWWRMDVERAPNAALEDEEAVTSTTTYEVGDRFLAVIIGPKQDASITLSFGTRMTGTFVDPSSGEVLGAVSFTGAPGEPWQVPVPTGREIVFLKMRKG
jgi:hypothetical protein